MQVTYAGQVIATEPDQGGLDGIQDFTPGGGKQLTQASTPTRATDAQTFPRGNRKRSITGSVILSTQADLETALRLRGSFYDGLPPVGDLVLILGETTLTYAGAVLEMCEVLKNQQGVSVGFKFTFIPQGPVATVVTVNNGLFNKDGVTPLLNKDGTPLQNKS
jgi:hypothetical protein